MIEFLRRLLHYLDAHAAAFQALGSLAAALLAAVLVGITAYYASLTRGTLRLLQQERNDRIEVARAPVENALRQLEQRLSGLEDTLAKHGPRPEVYQQQMWIGQTVNVVSQSGNAMKSADVADATAALAGKIQDLWNALPRDPGAYNKPLSDEEYNTRLAQVPQYIARIRTAIADVRTRLTAYVG